MTSASLRSSVLVAVVLLPATGLLRADEVPIPSLIGETVVIPEGDFGRLNGTVTFDGGVIEVMAGRLLSGPGDVIVTGSGQVLLGGNGSSWESDDPLANSLTLESGVEVIGLGGASLDSRGVINRGLIASDNKNSLTSQFSIQADQGFLNEGVMEARANSSLRIYAADFPAFNANGILRVLPDGELRLQFDELNSLSELGTIEQLGGLVRLSGVLNNTGQTMTFPAGNWQIYGSQVHGGTLETNVGGDLQLRAVNLYGVTVDTDITTPFASNTYVEDDLTVNGNWDHSFAIRFNGSNTVDGVGTIESKYGSAWFTTSQNEKTTFGPDLTLLATAGTSHRFLKSGTEPALVYELNGLTEADGGKIELGIGTHLENRGQILIHNGGELRLQQQSGFHDPSQLHNSAQGEIRVENGGYVRMADPILNEGSFVVDGGALHVIDYDVQGPGTVSINNSLILSAGTTLSELLSVPAGTGNEYGTASGTLDLEEGTLEIADTGGSRFTLRGGTIANGTINSLDGHPLVATTSQTGESRATTLINLQLNADLLVSPGATLLIHERQGLASLVSGAGNYLVDGGELQLGYAHSGAVRREQLERVVPSSGSVVLNGTLDNIGQTTILPAGVEWHIAHSRSDGIVGGRVEGEPGATLQIREGYGYAGYATLRQNVTLALPVVVGDTELYVREGLTLDQATVTLGIPNGDDEADARLTFIGQQALRGTGEILFNRIDNFNPATPSLRINMIEMQSDGTSAGLTIEEGITVRASEGSGYIGGSYNYQQGPFAVPITNHGQIIAENGQSISFFTSDFEQHGVLRAGADAQIIVHDEAMTNDGVFDIAGGTMHFSGDLSQSLTASLRWELSATETADAALQVFGQLELDGLLELSLAEGFDPIGGEIFWLADAVGGILGDFAGVQFPQLAPGLYWQLNRDSSSLWFRVLEGGPAGDFTSDGIVGGDDFLAWQRGQSFDPVSATDLMSWQANHGSAAAAASSLAVPEPGQLVSLVAALLVGTVTMRSLRVVD